MSRSTSPAVASAQRRTPGALVLVGITIVVLALGLSFSSGAIHTWWQVITLGVVEGLTEFLPISSTAHLLITANLLHFNNNIGGTFEIFIQLGAILAVIGYYARDLLQQARELPSSRTVQRFWFGIALAFIPAAVIGLLLRKWIKAVLFDSPTVIAWSLIIGGIVLIAVERWPRRATTHDVEQITPLQALGIGFAQVFALIPGVSRSGASIVGGMWAGLDRRAATAFSFYLAIPTLGAATVVDLLGSLHQLAAGDVARLAVGTVVSFIVAWLSIGWLLRYVSNHSFVAFGIYRIAAGAIILLLVAMQVLA
jgi:undecaprenyl-diphosphatase